MRPISFVLAFAVAAASSAAPSGKQFVEEQHFVGPRDLPSLRSTWVEALLVADVTGDGRNDLLYSGEEVYVFEARASGGYEPPVSSNPSSANAPLCAADLTGDGIVDLCTALYILPGDGRGRFGAPIAAGIDRFRLIGDFDRDGLQDTVTLDEAVELHRGNGRGGLAAPLASAVSTPYGTDAAAADLDGDGWPDVATAEAGALVVFWNERTGTFRRRDYRIAAEALEAGDMNGDGRTDLLITAGGETSAWFSGQEGRFARSTHLFDAADTHHALHDLDGNGTADVVGARDGAVSVALSYRNATFGATRLYFTGRPLTSLAVADVDSDGHPDVVTLWRDNEARPFRDAQQWLRGRGDGTLDSSPAVDLCQLVPCELGPRQEAVADVTGDGLGDYIIRTRRRLSVFAGRPDGTVSPAAVTPLPPLNAEDSTNIELLGDVNGDGRDDLLLQTFHRDWDGWKISETMTVLHGRTDGSFEKAQERVVIPRAGWGPPLASDFTGDGVLDILRVYGDLFPGDGGGRFSGPIPVAGIGDTTDDVSRPSTSTATACST
jgi:hypothetical protein